MNDTAPRTARALISDCLAQFCEQPDIAGALIATTDGQVVAAEMASGKQSLAAALIGSVVALSQSLAGLLGPSPAGEVMIASADGSIVVSALGTDHLVVVLGTSQRNMGAIRFDLRRLINQLTTIIAKDPTC
jgi:uncharacterized protein